MTTPSKRTPNFRITSIENNIYEYGGAIITPEILNIRVYSFIPPFNSLAHIHMVPDDQVQHRDGHFTKLYRRYESRNWRIEEIKPKEKHNEKREIHPQTGQLV